MKQETLEETTRNYSEKEYSTPIPLGICSDFARLGAKWQEERSYSEEEVINLLDKFGDHIDEWYSNGFNTETEITEKWFHKNKKK